jgi:uncharacterized protein (DUF488 family)
MTLLTIGFTRKSAQQFFARLQAGGARRLIDVRLNNTSQLAGFTKRDDLKYFTETICGIGYLHLPELAPTADILDPYKKHKGDWAVYERAFADLMSARRIEETIDAETFDGACLLCSEEQPHHCHRRLVAEYLKEKWGNVDIRHLI